MRNPVHTPLSKWGEGHHFLIHTRGLCMPLTAMSICPQKHKLTNSNDRVLNLYCAPHSKQDYGFHTADTSEKLTLERQGSAGVRFSTDTFLILLLKASFYSFYLPSLLLVLPTSHFYAVLQWTFFDIIFSYMFPSSFLRSSKIQEMPEQNHKNLRPSSSPFFLQRSERGPSKRSNCPKSLNKLTSEQEQLCFEETCWNTNYM